MSETTTLPNPVLPPERKCQLEQAFEPGFIELMQLVPRNPLVRACILSMTGKMPGAECQTFEQLKDWIEWHCELRVITSCRHSGRRAPSGGITLNVEFAETEYGRAHYCVRRSGEADFRVGADDLLTIVQDAVESGGGLGEVVDVIADKIDDDAWNQCDPDFNDYGDYEYNEHDTDGTEDGATSYSREEIRNAVLAFVRERHPELAAEL
jgi:hypothetical protein